MKHWTPNILLSYAYCNRKNIEEAIKYQGQYRMFLDSGAFTAYTKGKTIDLDEYCKFVKDPPFPIERYFMLDVIGDPKATWKNYQYMLDKGLTPIPVFTRGESLDMLDKYYEHSDLVGIGGVAGTPKRNEYTKWISENNDRPVHWLGVGDIDLIYYFKPYSCDSSNINYACRFGGCLVFTNNNFKVFTRQNFLKSKELLKLSYILGESIYCLKYEKRWRTHTSLSNKISMLSFLIGSFTIEIKKDTRYFCVSLGCTGLEYLIPTYKIFKEAYL